MSTLGSSPSFSYYYYIDSGGGANQVCTNDYTMPSAGWVTAVVFYADGDTGTSTLTGCMWHGSGGLIQSAGVSCVVGSKSVGGQAWHTANLAGIIIIKGTALRFGWTKAGSGASMVWSTAGTSGGEIASGGNPGDLGALSASGQPGAYIIYSPISPPSATTNAATNVAATTATLNGTVGDGGQHGSGDPNSSHYEFQYSTASDLSGAIVTSQVAFNGTGQPASQAITGLTVNTTYYFRVIAINDVGSTEGSILSFSTVGTPNAPTLTSPANNAAVNAQSSGVAFAWTYNTGGASGGETNYALKLTTGGVDSWWNGTALQRTEIYVAETTTKTVGAGILAPSVTYLWTVSSQDADGKSPYASAFTLVSEGPPASPTLISPVSGTYVDMAGATPTLSWTYNPGNAVGGQTNFAIRRKISGSSSYSYFNVGTNSWQSTIVWNIGSAQSYTFTSGLWVDGNTYNWSIATQDAGGQGNFAADWTLTAQAIPVVTVSAPSGTIATSKPIVIWSASIPSGASETFYRVRTFSAAQYGASGFNPATSATTDDSGAISSSSATQYQIAALLPAGTSYRSYVQVTETGSEASGFLAFGAYSVALDMPPTPTLAAVATTDPVTGCPMIQLTAQALINLLTAVDASFETGIGTYIGNNAVLSQSSAQALDGSYSLSLSAVAASTNMFASSGYYTVLPSTQYSLGAYFRSAVTSRAVLVQIAWFDSSHTTLAYSTSSTVNDTTTGWTLATVTGTSPSNAAYAAIYVIVDAVGAASEVHYVDEVGLFPGSGTVWSAGGFSATAGIVILRSDGVYVRLASPLNPAPLSNSIAPDEAVVNDYEVTPLVAYTYQALLHATGSQGLVQSAYSSSVGASVSTTMWWELDPTNPSGATAAQPIQWNPSNTEQSTAHQVLGQETMIVISSAMMGIDMTASMELFDAATWSDFYDLATSQNTIFFSDPFGNSYYFRIAPGPGGMSSGMGNKAHDTQLLPSTSAAPHRTLAITGIAQPRPAV